MSRDAFSYSKLSVGKRCPFQYKKQYLDFVSPIDPVDQTNINIGSVVHSVVENAINSLLEEPFDSISNEFLNGFIFSVLEKACHAKKLTTIESEAVTNFASALEHIVFRVLKFRSQQNGIVFVEKELAIDENFSPVDFKSAAAWFRGKLDLALVSRQGNVVIMDHKTGYKTLNGHEDQLRTYEVLAKFALGPELERDHSIKIKSIQTGLNFLSEDTVVWGKTNTPDLVGLTSRAWLVEFINTISKNGLEGKVKRGRHCNWCGYRSLCGSKVGQKKKAVSAVKEVQL